MLYEGKDYEPEALVALLDREIKSAKPSKTLLDKLGANPKTRAYCGKAFDNCNSAIL